jgi:hypothetical protein
MRLCPFIALIAALAWAAPSSGVTPAQQAELVGGTVLTQRGPGVGGFSGLYLDADGTGFIALSDRGALVRGTIRRAGDGRILGARLGPMVPLLAASGRPMHPDQDDSEGLAVGPDGTIYIAFEGQGRVEARAGLAAVPRLLPVDPSFRRFPPNRGLESLAIARDGALYALPEDAPLADGTIPLYRFAGDQWSVVRSLPASGKFLPVEADIGPDGALYLLERRFRGFLGFASQVRRFTLDGDDTGQILLTTHTGEHDNLEGLSVWRAPNGHLRLTMISDDNFFPAQRSEIVEYELRDGLVLPAVAR